ncbi:MAG: phosphodiester glycosidase family protein [Nostocaceae cyanobacterium]|nr:phosphodiester glycosidase family protein [Nostocaceae cyanobacterium]
MVKIKTESVSVRYFISEQKSARSIGLHWSPLLTTVLWLANTGINLAAPIPAKPVPVVQQSTVPAKPVPVVQSTVPPLKGVLLYGNQISLNGHIFDAPWFQRPTGSNQSTYLSDAAVRQLIGVDLLNTNIAAKQPVQWFGQGNPVVLSSLFAAGYRYLNITELVQPAGWQLQANGNTLVITERATKITEIREDKTTRAPIPLPRPPEAPIPLPRPPKVPIPLPRPPEAPTLTADHLLVNLDHPTSWQITQLTSKPAGDAQLPQTVWAITIDGSADPSLLARYAPKPPLTPLQELLNKLQPPTVPSPPVSPIEQVTAVGNQTVIQLSLPYGLAPQVTTVKPNRLEIAIRPDAMSERDITWARSLRWQQRYLNLGADRFPIVWLEINPRMGLNLRPIWASAPNGLLGSSALLKTAARYAAAGAINGGYFNRNNRAPLGAIKSDGQWLSSPILNRGAIAWNDRGQALISRLSWEETLVTNGQSLPIQTLNSGYPAAGIARYTPAWGLNYTPLADNEILLYVQNEQVTNQLAGGMAEQASFPIPSDGYLLVLRDSGIKFVNLLPVGATISLSSATTTPANFNSYPQIIGAGPVLVQNRQIVLDGKAEKFSDAFVTENAIRSAICTTESGKILIAAVHYRVGGAGATLAEHAQLMQQMGCIDALNLDGGSSTSLYLGGELLNRPASTAARVHNGIGIFLYTPLPSLKKD